MCGLGGTRRTVPMKSTSLLVVSVVVITASACGSQPATWGVRVSVALHCPEGTECEPKAYGVNEKGAASACSPYGEDLVDYEARVEGDATRSFPLFKQWVMVDGLTDVPRYEGGWAPRLYRLDSSGVAHSIEDGDAEVSIDGHTITARYPSKADPSRIIEEKHEILRLADARCEPASSRPGASPWGGSP